MPYRSEPPWPPCSTRASVVHRGRIFLNNIFLQNIVLHQKAKLNNNFSSLKKNSFCLKFFFCFRLFKTTPSISFSNHNDKTMFFPSFSKMVPNTTCIILAVSCNNIILLYHLTWSCNNVILKYHATVSFYYVIMLQ